MNIRKFSYQARFAKNSIRQWNLFSRTIIKGRGLMQNHTFFSSERVQFQRRLIVHSNPSAWFVIVLMRSGISGLCITPPYDVDNTCTFYKFAIISN